MRAAIVSLVVFFAAAMGFAQEQPVVLQPADGQVAPPLAQPPDAANPLEERLDRLERRLDETDRAAAAGKAAGADAEAVPAGAATEDNNWR
jgi:hypothetical protein